MHGRQSNTLAAEGSGHHTTSDGLRRALASPPAMGPGLWCCTAKALAFSSIATVTTVPALSEKNSSIGTGAAKPWDGVDVGALAGIAVKKPFIARPRADPVQSCPRISGRVQASAFSCAADRLCGSVAGHANSEGELAVRVQSNGEPPQTGLPERLPPDVTIVAGSAIHERSAAVEDCGV
jgi:hypothetical protein